MDFIAELQNLNYVAVSVATIASYILGFVWYHWAVFGNAWANALGLTKCWGQIEYLFIFPTT